MASDRRYDRPPRDQEAFAQRLVTRLGMEGAIQECWENQWLGTLRHIESLKQDQAAE